MENDSEPFVFPFKSYPYRHGPSPEELLLSRLKRPNVMAAFKFRGHPDGLRIVRRAARLFGDIESGTIEEVGSSRVWPFGWHTLSERLAEESFAITSEIEPSDGSNAKPSTFRIYGNRISLVVPVVSNPSRTGIVKVKLHCPPESLSTPEYLQVVRDWYRMVADSSGVVAAYLRSTDSNDQIFYDWPDYVPDSVPVKFYHWEVVIPVEYYRKVTAAPGIEVIETEGGRLIVSMGDTPVQPLSRRQAQYTALEQLLPHRMSTPLPQFERDGDFALWRYFAIEEEGGRELPAELDSPS